jgi:hypothetical protein
MGVAAPQIAIRFDLIKAHLVAAPVVKLGGAGAGVIGHGGGLSPK